MCGISFILSKDGSDQTLALEQMQDAQRHRGPDGSQSYSLLTSFGKLHFGHTRLKILDLSNRSNQPIISQSHQEILLYNGEIYNYHQISSKPPSDTIALSQWLSQQDKPNFGELRGIYAGLVYRPKSEEIWVFRDPSGIKPLFYYEDRKYLIVASEIKAILASTLVAKQLNPSQIHHYLHFRFAQAPQTFYKNIQEIEGLHIWQKGQFQSKQIIKIPQYPSLLPKISKLPELVQKQLLASVEAQLQADVKIGISLSGGVDSTLLLALARQLGVSSLPTFVVVDKNEQGKTDGYFARKAAQQYGSKLNEIVLSTQDLIDLPDFAASFNQPIADFAAWLTLKLSEVAKDDVKVLLSGAGADELFGGYNRHWAYGQYLRYKTLYLTLKYPLKLMTFITQGNLQRHLSKFSQAIQTQPEETFRNFTRLQTWHLFPEYNATWTLPFEGALAYDQRHFLKSDVLAINDQMAMQNGVEVRVPFLDENLQSLMRGYSEKQLWHPQKKWILKRILNNLGGNTYSQRIKSGFGLNLERWLRQEPLISFLEDLKDSNQILYEFAPYQKVKQFVTLHQSDKADFSQELWALLVLNYWLKANFG